MDYIWIFCAFLCGLAVKTINLPPSIGYLFAGFLLHFLGYQADSSLTLLSNIGITLMLFTIGLKLNVESLFKREVILGSSIHTLLWLIVTTIIIKLFTILAISYFSEVNVISAALIAFALSFSSTVCVIKLLEDSGEMKTRHGKLSVSILVIQDIIAVAFLVAATGKVPSVWAIALLAIFAIRPLILKFITHVGHGELIPLMGFFLALGSYELFEWVGIKGDLGALLAGMFLASHSKATEINKSLMSFKDIFLIGFFLSIGFTALPTVEMMGLATLLMLFIPIKFALFFTLFNLLKIRSRTAFLTALALTNFSEFGLIVTSISVSAGWLNKEWLVILALAVSFSFVITNIVYKYAHTFFSHHKEWLTQFERSDMLPEDRFNQPIEAPIIIIGMGRVGIGAYKAIKNNNLLVNHKRVWGLDADKEKVTWLNTQGVSAYYGDAEDAYFWERIDLSKLELVLLALPTVQDSISITKQLKAAHYQGKIAAIARFDDERTTLEDLGIDKVFNFYNEAGVGFAEESISMINEGKC